MTVLTKYFVQSVVLFPHLDSDILIIITEE